LSMALVLVLNAAAVVGLLALLAATMTLPLRLRSEPRGPQTPRAHWATRRNRAGRTARRRGVRPEPVYSRG